MQTTVAGPTSRAEPFHSTRSAAAAQCGDGQVRAGADSSRIGALVAENAVLARALADAQRRFTRYRHEQAALLEALQSALVQAHGRAILARSRRGWAQEAGSEPALVSAATAVCRTSAAAWRIVASRAPLRLLIVEVPKGRVQRDAGANRTGAP